MKHLLLTAATVLAFAASAVSAQASCADPRVVQGAHGIPHIQLPVPRGGM